jgi:glutamate/tyrosine decarboxylase-like PLP-dependent enzyme
VRELLNDVAARAARYREEILDRRVSPSAEALRALDALREPFPPAPTAPEKVLALLDELGSPATLGMAGPRFFGWVIGGTLPAALAANWLAGAWDQNPGLFVASPIATLLEEICLRWLADALALPEAAGGGFVTGATVANFTALAAARHSVLMRAGWDVEGQGLFGAPPVHVIVGGEGHPSLFKALGMLGLGRERVVRVPVDDQGRMRADAFPVLRGPAIVCIQAGNVNTGAFDPIAEICRRAHAAGAWVHVDGAFGLWGRASRDRRAILDGAELADSWANDAHKWLNVPYDNGIVIVRDSAAHRASMAVTAEYIEHSAGVERDPFEWTPEFSRRGRGFTIYAALRALGRRGVQALVDRCCARARQFAEVLGRHPRVNVLNDVVLNQVLVRFGDSDDVTREVITRAQREGTCWMAGTTWHGMAAMRLSISNWATSEEDIERSAQAILAGL